MQIDTNTINLIIGPLPRHHRQLRPQLGIPLSFDLPITRQIIGIPLHDAGIQ